MTKSLSMGVAHRGQAEAKSASVSTTRYTSSVVVMPEVTFSRAECPSETIPLEIAPWRISFSVALLAIMSRIGWVNVKISKMPVRPLYPVPPHSGHPAPR